jgi:DMSO/TMAO reductase YedYZ heme-binding membrane subunit
MATLTLDKFATRCGDSAKVSVPSSWYFFAINYTEFDINEDILMSGFIQGAVFLLLIMVA